MGKWPLQWALWAKVWSQMPTNFFVLWASGHLVGREMGKKEAPDVTPRPLFHATYLLQPRRSTVHIRPSALDYGHGSPHPASPGPVYCPRES